MRGETAAMTMTIFRNPRTESATQSSLEPAPSRRAAPLAVKVVLVLVVVNLFVAAMVLLKLRAPHLG